MAEQVFEAESRFPLLVGELGVAYKPAEVAVPLAVFGQKEEMVAPNKGDLSPKERMDASIPGCQKEAGGTVQPIVVGEGEVFYPQFGGPVENVLRGGGTF